MVTLRAGSITVSALVSASVTGVSSTGDADAAVSRNTRALPN